MKLFVLGATGKTGGVLVAQAVAHGHSVTTFGRSPFAAVDKAKVLSISGNPMNEAELADALPGHDAVLSVLGTRGLGATTVLVDSSRATIAALSDPTTRKRLEAAVGLSEDMSKGIIDRFRSLPMSRSAVLAGRTIADLVRNVFVVLLMIVVGMAVGFRFHNGFLAAVAAVLVALLLGYSLSWVFALIGLTVADPESAQLAGFLPIFPLVFASSVFTSIRSMPGWLQAFAKVQPITRAANTVRALTEGGPVATSLIWTIVWSIAILAVFAPLAVRRYRQG